MDKLVKEIGKALAESINGGYKFFNSKFSLRKKENGGWKGITVDVLPTSQQNFVKIALHAHLRLDELEKLYTPYHLFLTAKEAKDHSTLSVNCDQLFSDKSIIASFELTPQNLPEVISKYAEAIRLDILPFLDKFFSEDALVSSFENSNPRKWVSSDRLVRYLVLLSAHTLRKEWDLFDKYSGEFSLYCQKPHAQVYKPLAEAVINGLRNNEGRPH